MIKTKKRPYAGTTVAAERSYSQIQQFLLDSGCEAVQITRSAQGEVSIRFSITVEVQGVRRAIGFEVRPAILARQVRQQSSSGPLVTVADEAASARLAYWYIKSKVEAVAYGLVSVEREFFAQILVSLPDGRTGTVGDLAARAVLSGDPMLLPGVDVDSGPRSLPRGGG